MSTCGTSTKCKILTVDDAMDNRNLSLYPIVIRESRYGGVYENGMWHAIANCESEAWNADYFDYLYGDDEAAIAFWWESEAAKKVGVGKTPNDALADLFKKQFA